MLMTVALVVCPLKNTLECLSSPLILFMRLYAGVSDVQTCCERCASYRCVKLPVCYLDYDVGESEIGPLSLQCVLG